MQTRTLSPEASSGTERKAPPIIEVSTGSRGVLEAMSAAHHTNAFSIRCRLLIMGLLEPTPLRV